MYSQIMQSGSERGSDKTPQQTYDVVEEAGRIASHYDSLYGQPPHPNWFSKRAQRVRDDLTNIYKRAGERLNFQDGLVIGSVFAFETVAVALKIREMSKRRH